MELSESPLPDERVEDPLDWVPELPEPDRGAGLVVVVADDVVPVRRGAAPPLVDPALVLVLEPGDGRVPPAGLPLVGAGRDREPALDAGRLAVVGAASKNSSNENESM